MRRWRFRRPRRDAGTMTCKGVQRLLQQYLDDQLDDALAARLAAHLDDCRRCGLDADTYRRIKRALANRREPLPQDALDRLRAFAEAMPYGHHRDR